MDVFKFVIEGRLDGLNEYTAANRSNRYAGAALKTKNQGQVLDALEAAGLLGQEITEPVYISFTWYEKNRRRDPDNVAFAKKFILDALVSAEVLKNDDISHVVGFSDEIREDKLKPRIEVIITRLG